MPIDAYSYILSEFHGFIKLLLLAAKVLIPSEYVLNIFSGIVS